MRMTDRIKSELLLYVVTAALAILLLVPVLRLDAADLSAPLSPGGDQLFYQGIIAKPLMTQPWYLYNPSLSAPDGLLLHDFPTGTDSLLFLLIKLISVTVGDTALGINIFYLLTYPLAAMAMLFAARSLKLQRALAVAVAVLFAFAPYHLWRGEGHLALSAYFMLPIGLVIALRVDRLLAVHTTHEGAQRSPNWKAMVRDKSLIAACVFSVLVALTGVYYAFFYGVILVMIAARRAILGRSWVSLVVPALLGAIIVGTVLLSVSPTLLYQARNGTNPGATSRSAADAEVYAMRPIQLVLPIEGHRIPALNSAALLYREFLTAINPVLDNETRLAALGIIASLGFGFLLAWSLLGLRVREDGAWADYHLEDLASVNITMLLLGTVGGIGFIIANTLTSLIRAYNRVSIVIAMVALLAVGALLDRALRRLPRASWVAVVVALALVGVGLFDQTGAIPTRVYAETKAANQVQREFGASAEKYLPAGTSVFQLPYVAFPGAGRALPEGFADYDLLLPYIYSDGLKWSFGAMRGRSTAAWQEQVSALPMPELLAQIKAKGFSAIYVDRRGYEDGGDRIVAEIEFELGQPGVESSDGRMLLWRIGE